MASSHDAPGIAAAQSATCAGVAPVLGAARAFVSAIFAADVHVSTSPYSSLMKKGEQALYLAQRAVAALVAAWSAVTVPAVLLPEHAAIKVAAAVKVVSVRIAGIVLAPARFVPEPLRFARAAFVARSKRPP